VQHHGAETLRDGAGGQVGRPGLELVGEPIVERERELFLCGEVAIGEPDRRIRRFGDALQRRLLVSFPDKEVERGLDEPKPAPARSRLLFARRGNKSERIHF
jgi:hypothetical protein